MNESYRTHGNICLGSDMLWDFDFPHHVQHSVHTCSCTRLAIQTSLGRQGPITILSRLGWFSGSNPCSRCLLSTHLLWQASDKQRLLKEVFHKQILPAGPWLKRAFLSPSSGTQPIELQPSEACIEAGYGPALHPSGPGPPSHCPWTPVSTYPQRGNPPNSTLLPKWTQTQSSAWT